MIQGIPKSPQMKGTQPKPPAIGDPASSSSKDKKKKDKKKKDGGKEADSPKPPGKGGKLEEGKLPYPEPCDQVNKGEGLLNGSSDPHQSRLASIKAEADKIYSFMNIDFNKESFQNYRAGLPKAFELPKFEFWPVNGTSLYDQYLEDRKSE